MEFFKHFSEMMISLPLFAFAATGAGADVDRLALSGYGHNEIKICYQGKTKEIKAKQLASFIAKGATLGKCPTPPKEDHDDKKDDDKKGDDKSKSDEKKVTVKVEAKKK
jgi:hypothetical protein